MAIQKIKSFLDILSKEMNSLSSLRVIKYKNKKEKFDDKDDKNEDSNNSKDDKENKEEAIRYLKDNSRQVKLVNQGLVLIRVLDEGIKSTNVMIDYIISRIFQFVQG